jgi:GR25 family glycosyltransferase involved in LPS biosynthesis
MYNFKTVIINLKRRHDRKMIIEAQLKKQGFTDDEYAFMEAVDGTQLTLTPEIYELFKDNDFNYRSGVIGCAMSHITLWKQLINDSSCNCYVIIEDDAEFVENFKLKLGKAVELFNDNTDAEYCLISTNFLGRIKSPCTNVDNLQLVKKNNYEVEGTGGYIIKKSGAIRFMNHYNKHSMTQAIDTSIIYNFNENIYEPTEYLIKSVDSPDTDVQNDVRLRDDNHNPNKGIQKSITRLTVAFCDWWEDEYGGGSFDLNDNFFVNILKMHSGAEVKIVEPCQTPDILFYSVFGYNHGSHSARRKVFFSGESKNHDPCADFNMTFDESNSINTRIPLWICYFDTNILKESLRRIESSDFPHITKRDKFCSYIASHSGFENNRQTFVEKLSKYKKVDCGGRHLNNIGMTTPLGINASGKIEHNKQYRFAIAFENKQYPGYVTEKICDVYKSGCIPIYWGTPDVVKDFNPSTFVNANDFSDFDALVEHVRRVDCNDELYASYFKNPILSDAWIKILTDPTCAFFKQLASNISNCRMS